MIFISLAAQFAMAEVPPIVGGSETSNYRQVGAIVAIHPQYGGASFCSATLIHRYWVLTAAHCIEGQDAALDMADDGFKIYFVTAQNVYSASYSDLHEVNSNNMIPHPYYNDGSMENDIGLLQLMEPLDSLDPIPLNTSRPNNSWNWITYVGYGITTDGEEDSGKRRTVDVPFYTYDSMFVYTYDSTGQTNICSGDSGGAALLDSGNGLLLAGVNSFGFDINYGAPHCEGEGAAAGATRVDSYLDFIEQYVEDVETGSSSSGGSGSGGSGSGGSGSGSSDSDSVEAWEPPLADNDYGTLTIPAPASGAGCSQVSGAGSASALLIGLSLLVGRREKLKLSSIE